MQLEKCPKCGNNRLLLKKKTTTRKGEKIHRYEKWYVAHYLPKGVSKSGKRVNRARWCYVNVENSKKITQTHPEITQTKKPRKTVFRKMKRRR